MRGLPETAGLLTLGLFWGLSPAMSRLMGEAGLPISHVLVVTGVAVGIGLEILRRLQGGAALIPARVWLYGLGCGVLINIPFTGSLYFARVLPITTYALAVSTAPFFSYALALMTGREKAQPLRLAALVTGFVASALLIVTRGGTEGGGDFWLLVACFCVPALYALYHFYASVMWPVGMEPLAAGVTESFASAALAVPFLLVMAPQMVGVPAYGLALVASVMWIAERVAFFWLLRRSGPVVTMQAVYISTPGGVIAGAMIFSEPADGWLFVSLGLILLALWLNMQAMRKVAAV
ncbi:MAG: DMT family transporter [Aestuariivirgaceae bacterium]|nr:DMT family transporter [Aestuariivirgaceae bacterium]